MNFGESAVFDGEKTSETALFVGCLKTSVFERKRRFFRRLANFDGGLFFDREAERFRFRFLNDFQLDSGFGRRFRFRRVEVF